MTILGFRDFLITMTQSGSKSPKLRYCVVEKFLSSLEDFFLLNIDDVWKSMVIGVLTPPDLFLVMLISAFNLFYLLETQGIFMEIARGKWSVYDTSRAHRIQIESSHPGFQLLAVPILATFLALLLLPPRDLGILFSCLVIVICEHF